ncbi:apolipoprotein N-acyltransferase [Sphingomonas kaistensis]|uniref:Apolipoprotein N-acyltransferase n=1 Tax=Sphingomonas kaistensis TaxID=298708 RepID=A0A7X5Y621_9SPHN|nr:apolipoprotein N-acyltransferase [Sphingomonas kaistensis]
MTFRTSHLLAAFPLGLASALAFEPVGLWPLMPLAFAALAMLISRSGSMGRALLTGWLFGAGQFMLGLNWIATAFTYQAAMPAWLGWLAVFLLSLYLAVYPALAAGLAWRFGQRSPLALAFALTGGWALGEWLRATMFTGFAWNPVGVSLLDTFWRGTAAGIGTYGLSMLVVALGGALFLAFAKARRSAAVIAVALLGLGLLGWLPSAAPQVAGGKAIRVVQPNIGQEDKWREGLEEEAFRRLTSLSTLKPGADPTLLLWPEVAVPVAFQLEGPPPPRRTAELPPAKRAGQVLRPGSDLLVTGAFTLVVDGQANLVGSTNSVMPITADGRILGRYDKAHLVPYGEYLPMRPILSAIGLSQLAPGVGDTLSGPGPRNLALPGWGTMGLQICYEIIFSGQVIDPDHRPDFLFNPSNDAWFGSWGPPQHLAQARLRAAEERIPVIRSTPTGISAVVDANGTVLASLPWRTAGVIDARLPLPGPPTSFSRFGNLIPLGLAFLLLLFAVGMDARGRYRRHI